MKRSEVKTLALMAMYCAIFVVLDRVSDLVHLFELPNGGKLNLGPIALLMCSYHLGYKKGSLVAFVSVFLQLAIGSVKWYGPTSFILDYLVSYTVYGLAELFPNFGFFYSGIVFTSILRLLSSTVSGMLNWQTPFFASLVYNASYIVPTTICALIVVPLLAKRLFNK